MDPSMIISLAGEGLKLVNHLSQLSASKRIAEDSKRPDAEIPEALKEQLAISRRNAQMRDLAGQSTMEARLGSNTSQAVGQGIRGADSQANLLDFIGGQYKNQQQGMQDIGMAGAQQWQQSQEALKNNLSTYGEEERRLWQLNKFEPYQIAAAKAAALQKAGSEGLSGALGGMGSIIGQGQINSATNKYYDKQGQLVDAQITKLLGGGGSTGTDGSTGSIVGGINQGTTVPEEQGSFQSNGNTTQSAMFPNVNMNNPYNTYKQITSPYSKMFDLAKLLNITM